MARTKKLWAWGWEDKLPLEGMREALAAQLAAVLSEGDGAPWTPEARPLPRLEDVTLAAPRVAVPEDLSSFVTTHREERVRHTYGRSFRDILRGLTGDFAAAPDWVAVPTTEADIEALFTVAARERLAVVPYGGGTSVVGGVEAEVCAGYRGAVSVDLRSFDRVLEVDATSRAARIQAGIFGPALEAALAPTGLTLRFFPQSFEHSTLGGWIATRAGGHFATLYTHIDDLVESVRMVTPVGVFETRRLPSSGAGPSPERLVLGSEGTLGILTEAWMRLQARPRWRAVATVKFDTFDRAVFAARALAQSGLHPTNCRLLDAREALLNVVSQDGRAVMVVAFESADHPLEPWMTRALALVADHGGTCPDGPRYKDDGGKIAAAGGASAWKSAFVDAPYLQSGLVAMGAIVDTFETACTWDRFPGLDAEVTAAVEGAMNEVCGKGLLTRRFTHVYPDGPAPYYTFLAPGRRGAELEQWAAIKKAASDALLAGGATITHHHAVGRVHRPWYERERSPVFGAALAAVKDALDPHAVLSPGVLLAPRSQSQRAPRPPRP